MKIVFESSLDPKDLMDHCVSIEWDDCAELTEEGFRYETRHKSAILKVDKDGKGSYEGQRSLLFSHSIFARLTRAWLVDQLTVVEKESGDMNRPAFFYMGTCYMKDLRMEAIAKETSSLEHGEVFLQKIQEELEFADHGVFSLPIGTYLQDEVREAVLYGSQEWLSAQIKRENPHL